MQSTMTFWSLNRNLCVVWAIYIVLKKNLVNLCNFVVQKPYPSQSVNCFGRFVYNSKKGRGSNTSDIGGGYLHTGHSSPLTELQQDLLGIETSRYPIAVFPAIDHVVTWVLFIQGWDHHYLAAHLLGHQIWHRWVSLGSVQFAGSLHFVSEPPSGLWAKIQRRWSVEIMVWLDLWSSENNIITTCASPTYSEVSSSLVLACGPMVLTLLRSTLVSITCDRQKPGKSADLHSFHRFFTCQTNQLTCIEIQGSDKYLSNTIYYSML